MVKTLALYLTLSRFSSKSLLWHIRPKAINIIWSLLTLQPSALNFLQFKIYTLGQAELLPVPSGLDLCVFFAVSITVYLFFFFFWLLPYPTRLQPLFIFCLTAHSWDIPHLTVSYLANSDLCSNVIVGRFLQVWFLLHDPLFLSTPSQCSSDFVETASLSNGVCSSLVC